MPVKELEETLDELYQIDGVEACILYRIDGTPIALRTPGYDENLLEIMFWLKNHVKYVMMGMEKEGFEGTEFIYKKHRIMVYATSKSSVLVTIIEPEAHLQLTSLEITRATTMIGECMS